MKSFKYAWAIFCIILGAIICYPGFMGIFRAETFVTSLIFLALGLWLADQGFKVFRKKKIIPTEDIK